MKKSDFKGIYAEMSEILGEEIVKIIHKLTRDNRLISL